MKTDTDLNPQGKQMADESMVRNLDAQARAIWPQEQTLLARYLLPEAPHILDAGCGTGEGASRFASYFPNAQVMGVDIIDSHLKRARSRFAQLGSRLSFENRSIFELGLPKHSFDLTVCRHVLQSIPHPEKVLVELVRVTRPGGYLHLIPEDYGMLHFEEDELKKFWDVVPKEFGAAVGTDFHIGRHIFGHLVALGLRDITIDYVVVDPLRVPRETFATILEAWRDGFSEAIGQTTAISQDSARELFNRMIAQVRDSTRYFIWMVPVVSARCPDAMPLDRDLTAI
jgi:ubiquinone/menaquinone biosynthesis C-methylase UbiE